MLKIKDLTAANELNTAAMNKVVGGLNPFASINTSFRSDNKVVDMDQVFAFNFTQANAGNLTNNQAIIGGNGTVRADADQRLDQDNHLRVANLGNAFIS